MSVAPIQVALRGKLKAHDALLLLVNSRPYFFSIVHTSVSAAFRLKTGARGWLRGSSGDLSQDRTCDADALDARWRQPRRLKELETLRQVGSVHSDSEPTNLCIKIV